MEALPIILSFIAGIAAGLIVFRHLFGLEDQAQTLARTPYSRAVPSSTGVSAADANLVTAQFQHLRQEVLEQASELTIAGDELKANFEELKQQVAVQSEAAVESINEKTICLFDTLTDTLREESKSQQMEHQEYVENITSKFDERLAQVEDSIAQWAEKMEALDGISSSICIIQVALKEVQEQFDKGNAKDIDIMDEGNIGSRSRQSSIHSGTKFLGQNSIASNLAALNRKTSVKLKGLLRSSQ